MEALSNPRIYVGTYYKYTISSIAGEWLDLTKFSTREEFYKACKRIHKDEKDPEFMFQDFGNFPELFYCECNLGNNFFEYMSVIADMDVELIEAFNYFVTDIEEGWSNAEKMKSVFEASFQGNYGSTLGETEMNFTNSYVDEHVINQIPDHLQIYFDYEQYSRTLFLGSYTAVGNYVFYLQ